MIRRPPRATRTDTLFPYTTLHAGVQALPGIVVGALVGEQFLDAACFDLHLQFCVAPPFFIGARSEEHTSELQSLMRISYAVFCLKKKTPFYSSPISPVLTNATTIISIPLCALFLLQL